MIVFKNINRFLLLLLLLLNCSLFHTLTFLFVYIMSAPTSSPDSVLAATSEPLPATTDDTSIPLPALETKKEADESNAKKPYVMTEEEKRQLYEAQREHSRRLNLVTDPYCNTACGVLPSQLAM